MNSPHPPQPWIGELLLLAALWGATFMFMRLGVHEFGAVATAGMRVTMATLFLLPVLLWRRQGPQLLRHWKATFVMGLLNSAIPFAFFAFALQSITTGLSSILNATAPMFGAVVAWIWFKDRPHGLRILGLVLGFVGVALLAWDKASFKPDAAGLATGWAVLACLFGCVFYGLAASYAKRHLKGVPALVSATGSQLGATLVLAPPTLWLWPQRMPSATAWLAMVAVGVLCTGIAYILFYRLIENVGPARALTVTFIVPLFAVLYGALFLGETVSSWMLFCGVIILVGTALSANLLRLRR